MALQLLDPLEPEAVKALIRETRLIWGGNVAKRRLQLGWSVEIVAAIVGVTSVTIKRLEAGEMMPRDRIRIALADALQTSQEKLFPYASRQRIAELRDAA